MNEQLKIDKLIINSPYEEPKYHLHYDRESRSFIKREDRRSAGYVVATPGSIGFDDPGMFYPLPLVNKIRERVSDWHYSGYKGVTSITKRLLEHWGNSEEREGRRFFFCQLDAIETIIWFTEASDSDKVGIEIPSDGGLFRRLCSKMATGSGKTVVMSMLIAWQILNKVTYPQDTRFSKNILVIAPGLTVKNRLQVLIPAGKNNYYDEFSIVPPGLNDKLRQGKVKIHNWHVLNWETNEQITKKRSVDKRGAKSYEAYTREVLGEMSNANNIVVINDEAHHAWRVPAESKIKGIKKEEIEEATKWIGGLDRIHKTRSIQNCYDFSATPFAPSGKRSSEEALFDWVISDFSLNDAIESGLVKTPRIVIRDDGKLTPDFKSRFYHIYNDPEVKDDLIRKAEESELLPPLVDNAYYLLGVDWLETLKVWKEAKSEVPPVMISVANSTDTAARIKYSFDHKRIKIEELCDPERTLHIDSSILDKAESKLEEVNVFEGSDAESEDVEPKKKLTKEQMAEMLRLKVDTVGQVNQPGEQIQNVISVQMLSEGWDAKTVTHVMGLRAFTSQLLCEQVVGRGLRRTSYELNQQTGLFDPEYVNIFGVPFTFLPHETSAGSPPVQKPKTEIKPLNEKVGYEIKWPNIVRIEHTYKSNLKLNIDNVEQLNLDAYNTATLADMAPAIQGKPDVTKIETIHLEKLGQEMRMQRIMFETARDVYGIMNSSWKGNKEVLLGQVIKIVEEFLKSDKIQITPPLFERDELRKRILLTLNMTKIVRHIWESIRQENTEKLELVFDSEYPIRSTGDMRPWYTAKPCEYATRSHINFCVFDGTWEASEAFVLDHNSNVESWAKNDHLGFRIPYIFNGVFMNYYPDFLIKLSNGEMLVLETKGRERDKDITKRRFLAEWTKAVNEYGGFGKWHYAVSRNPADVGGIIDSVVSCLK